MCSFCMRVIPEIAKYTTKYIGKYLKIEVRDSAGGSKTADGPHSLFAVPTIADEEQRESKRAEAKLSLAHVFMHEAVEPGDSAAEEEDFRIFLSRVLKV